MIYMEDRINQASALSTTLSSCRIDRLVVVENRRWYEQFRLSNLLVLITIGFQCSINWSENLNCAQHLWNGEHWLLISSCRKHMCFLWCRELIKRQCSTQHFSSSPCSCLITVFLILRCSYLFLPETWERRTVFLYTVRAGIPSFSTPRPLT
jgi:hypothetical protein